MQRGTWDVRADIVLSIVITVNYNSPTYNSLGSCATVCSSEERESTMYVV